MEVGRRKEEALEPLELVPPDPEVAEAAAEPAEAEREDVDDQAVEPSVG